MSFPKGYRNNIKVIPTKIGFPRREQLRDDIVDKGTYLPKSVFEEDMDEAFVNFIKSDKRVSMTIDGEKIPVIFLTIQRWTEFSKTWQNSDKYKNIKLPFITVLRKPDIQQGQNQAGLWNIPGRETYTIVKVPTFDGIRNGVDLYKIPQPTSVDITYEVRIFTNRMKDLNKYNRLVQKAFQSRQCYINVKEHPMPLHLETIGDESNIDDFETRRYYVQLFEMKLLGYILDEADFEVKPTLNRMLVTTEIIPEINVKNITFTPVVEGNCATFTFVFEPAAEQSFSFISQYNLIFTQLVNVQNISRIVISINGVGIFDGLVLASPIIINNNDNVSIRVYKPFYSLGRFQLLGSSQ